LISCALGAQAGTLMKVNEFEVYRDGNLDNWLQGQNLWLREGFDNGNAVQGPDLTGGGTATYTLVAASNPLTVREAGGQLLMDAALADLSVGATGSVGHSVRTRFNTNVTDADRGLPISRSFGVIANVSLDALPDSGSQFGIRLADSFSNASDMVELSLVQRASGYGILFRKQDFLNHTITDLAFTALAAPTGATGLVLGLAHPVADSNVVGAFYGYADSNGDLIGGLQSFSATTTAFNGELHTQAELRATAAVPEPATWALMLGGAGALAGMRWRRRA
tara:strand:+ start:218 stop:1054 length:837 start_codon:yes stop_codon:yes gene_type:complete